jgi:spore coat protein A, manganese oxidase
MRPSLWTRRRFMQHAAVASVAATSAPFGHAQMQMPMKPPGTVKAKTLDASKLKPFVDPLPLPILQKPSGKRNWEPLGAKDAAYYEIRIRQIRDKMHRDLSPSNLWSYGETSAPILIETKQNEGVLIQWHNDLPPKHILPLAAPMAGMEMAPQTRVVAHIHGARVPHVSDGYPTDWFAPGASRICFYPNQQDATALWMHDHAMGMGRFNIFAGLMGWYLIRDEAETELNLPSGKYELPLLIYDRSFTPDGQLYYPNPPDEGAWSQEFLGDAMLVNGKVQPFYEVEPRKYRLRIANTANSRFFSLSLSSGQSFHVIGSDQGLLSEPAEMRRIIIAPAERVDLIVDFSLQRGRAVVLTSDGLDLMQFRVSDGAVEDRRAIPAKLRPVKRIVENDAVRRRPLTLNEYDGDNGQPMVMLLNHKHWSDPVTEEVRLNSTEIWEFLNLTQDTHPIHLHLVRFQLLNRQPFSVDDYLSDEVLRFTGPSFPPHPHETGWKDVIQCPPESVTRIIIPFRGYTGRYVWHCHILEHEANEMMRPYEIFP